MEFIQKNVRFHNKFAIENRFCRFIYTLPAFSFTNERIEQLRLLNGLWECSGYRIKIKLITMQIHF